MVRTLMDERYYYGIRQEAANILSKVSHPNLITVCDWVVCDRTVILVRRVPSPACVPEILLFPSFNDTNKQRLQRFSAIFH